MDDKNNFDDLINTAFADMDRIIKEMDSTLRHFAFGGFSTMDSENFNDQMIQNGKQEDNTNLRDQYLKKNDDVFESSKNQIKPMFPKSFFDQFFNHSSQNQSKILPFINENDSIENFDEDLDKKLSQQKDQFLKHKNDRQFSLIPKFESHSKSVSIRRIQRPDGTIEETTTTKDSSGKEETRVTRIIGDKSHSIIKRKESDGTNETEELFQNFDDKNIDDFNKNWENLTKKSPNNFRSMFDYNPILNNPTLPDKNNPNPDNQQQQQHHQQYENSKISSFLSKMYSWFK